MKKREKMYESFERGKAFKTFKKLFGWLLTKKPKIVYKGHKEDILEPTIFICNHGLDGTAGLYCNEIHFPFKYAPIGQFEVFLGFTKRWQYLYTFNHRLRRGLGRIPAFFAATFEGLFARFFYKRCRAIPSYKDLRVLRTFKMCHQCLDEGISLMVYPEHLDYGYNSVFLDYISGFASIAKSYYERSEKDVKVCPVYYSGQTRQLIIGEPLSVIEMFKEGKTKEEIAHIFTRETNQLYMDHVLPVHNAAEEKYRKKNKTDDVLI